jgi:hypothetical protein
MPIEIKKRYFCDWPGCGKEVMPYGQVLDVCDDKDPRILIVIMGTSIKIDGVLCPEHSEEILKNGKLINPYLLKEDVDKAIREGKILV